MAAEQPDVSLVLPVYEEAASLDTLAQEICTACEAASLTFEAFFIDDGSKDGSWEVIVDRHAKDPRFRGIRFQRNYGKSAALAAGFKYANGSVVVTLDTDLQDNPAEIPDMVAMIRNGYDLVSGWKATRRDPWSKKGPSRLFNVVTRLTSGIKLRDFNCGLKAYRRDVVHRLNLYGEMHRYIPLLVKWAGFESIGEMPVDHRARQHGRSKFGSERYMRGLLDLVTVSFLVRFGARPMHFFGTLGLTSFLAGTAISLWLSLDKLLYGNPIGDRPLLLLGMLLIVVGAQTFLTGFLADILNRGRMEEAPPYAVAEVLE